MCTYRQTYTYDTGTDALFLPSRCGGLSLLHHVVLAAFGGLPSKRRRTGAGSHPYNGMYGMQVYGALPPEARRQQAALFNGPPNQHSGDSSGSSGSSGSSCSDNGSGISGDRSSSSGSSASSAAMGRRSHSAPAQRQHRTGPDEPTEYGYHGSWVTSSTRVRQSSQSGSELSGSDSFGSGSTSGSGSAAFHHHQVLCASDAIGMGLNLNIRRVVFTSLHKYDGTAVRPLQPSEIRQIAGRAGRFASSHPTGYVTTLRPGDLPALHRALALRSETITRACLLPSSEALAEYAALHPDRHLATSLLTFAATAKLGDMYVYGNYDGMYGIASALRELGGAMSTEELMLFCTAPADMDDPAVSSALLRFAAMYCRVGRVGPEEISDQPLPQTAPTTEAELKRLEELHRVYDLYVWLCYRLPYAFTGREEAETARAECGGLIGEGLDRLAAAPSSAGFGRRNLNHHNRHHNYHFTNAEKGKEDEDGADGKS
ncbi:hypothetical protein Vretimale_13239 [Volvox reticuliferus]|uniref:RNA helicase n=1 Tax=Volvox reticuliferus TaxID=1737510 RepID=A0A8J4GJT9_9CHLO|nr:hypothetical protein Vretimale_13239 [Volvox reticuliferus]